MAKALTFKATMHSGSFGVGRIVEPRRELKRDLEALTLELFRPSRGLSGRVALRVERDLRRVTDPIPIPVLKATREYRDVFRAWTYLEPIYAVRRRKSECRLLRSLDEVRREHCRPIDPIVIGWKGAGPRKYGLRFLESSAPAWRTAGRNRRLSTLGELVFLVGPWD